jgi:hypothetical protein
MKPAAFLTHSHRRTAFASTPMVGIQGPAVASVGGRTRPAQAGLFFARLAPGGLRNRGNPRGPCAGRQEPGKRIVRSESRRSPIGGFFFSGCQNRSGNGEWQTVTIVADYWQAMQRV